MKKYLYIFALLLLFSCGKKQKNPVAPPPPAAPTANELAADGWTRFTQAKYDSAKVLFDNAMALEPEHISANVGKGWSLIMLGSTHLQLAIINCEKGVNDKTWKYHSQCAIIVAKFNLEKYYEVPPLVDICLKDNSTYAFTYKSEIDWHDLLIMKAQSLYFSRKYQEAWVIVKKLTPEYNYIDPQASETWKINDANYFSFEAVLSRIIQIMSDVYK